MSVDVNELGRLMELYRRAGHANPVRILQDATDLAPEYRSILKLVVDNAPADRRQSWRDDAHASAPRKKT